MYIMVLTGVTNHQETLVAICSSCLFSQNYVNVGIIVLPDRLQWF